MLQNEGKEKRILSVLLFKLDRHARGIERGTMFYSLCLSLSLFLY